jgi:hypothetical protein
MSLPRYVAAMRAYKWDDDIAALAARFFANCPDARHVILMNEARGPVSCGAFEKVSHGEDFAGFGLPEWPVGQSLWFNGDYACIFLRQALPDYDFYIVTESDVAVNTSLEPIVRHAAAQAIDGVMHWIQPADPGWYWYAQALAQDDPWQACLFVGIFSGRAIDLMLRERQALAVRFAAGETGLWPIVESFIPTAMRAAGMTLSEIRDFADTSLLEYRPFKSPRDPAALRPGSLVHPVSGGEDLVRRFLSETPVLDFFQPGTAASNALSHEALAPVAGLLWDALISNGDHRDVPLLHAAMRARGLVFPHRRDLAYGKPSRLSSVSEWSRDLDPELDAAGANGVAMHEECAFHTAAEPDAWWMVDLLDECVIDQVRVVNRGNIPERFRDFVIESSSDGALWRERLTKADDLPVSSDADAPWSADFEDPFPARFVRIRRLGEPDYLHLRRVQLFGRPALPIGAD